MILRNWIRDDASYMYKAKTDIELIERVKSDDEVAYKELFCRYFKDVCYYSYKTYPDEHKAKDFAQEVFLDFWKRRKSIQINTSLKAYLVRAVKYKSIDFIRAQKINFEDDFMKNNEKSEKQDLTEFKELKDLIHHTVDNLPKKCKIIFSMSRFQQLSHGEISKELGISKKTIENQITKALKVLRQSIIQYQLD